MITACLLVYNHAHILSKILDTILAQSYRSFELIISDDCSTDDSLLIAKSFEKIDSRITVIQTPTNLGMAGNANFAMNKAKSAYCALLHHDDLLDINTFDEWIACIEKNVNIAFVFNDYRNAQLSSTNYLINHNLKYSNTGKYILKKFLLKYWGCPVRGTALIRKKYFDEVGGMNEKFGMLADVDLWMRLSARWDVGYVNKPLMEVLEKRPQDYPKDYTDFSWNRLFTLFDIHSSNINRNNYPNYFQYLFKRFVFRHKVSFEIIKWNIYAIIRNKKEIIYSYKPDNNCQYFYSKWLVLIVRLLFT